MFDTKEYGVKTWRRCREKYVNETVNGRKKEGGISV